MHSYPLVKARIFSCSSLLFAALLFFGQARVGGQLERRGLVAAASQSLQLKGDLVVYPNAQIAFICGPQLRSGSTRNPYPWFDRVAIEHGHLHGRSTPRFAPRQLTGTVSVQRGSTVVGGAATRFLSEVDPNDPAPLYDGWLRVKMADGKTYREAKVSSVISDSRLVLTAPWAFDSVAAASADTFHSDAQRGWNYDVYYDSNYYDLALTQYINYYRTGDARFLEYARKTADAWWHSHHIADGTVTGGPNHLPPRSMAFAGLMLRAMDGRPEMWDYLEREVQANFTNWVYLRKNNPTLYYDIRDDGYAQLYAVMMAKVLPDRYPLYAKGTLTARTGATADGATKRATYLSQSEDTAVNFFGRLQRPDGSWRWDVDEGSSPAEQFRDVEQPFMVGLYLESAMLLHELTSSERVRANLRAQIVKACRHLFRDTYRGAEVVSDMPRYRWRGMFYYWGGGNTSDPRAYERGKGQRLTNGDPGMIRQVRHLNSTVHHAFGGAYSLTGDPEFLRMGDEVFDASFGEQVDGLHGLADEGRAKNYAMNFRASGRYLAWRLAGAQSATLISSQPSPSPPRTTHRGTSLRSSARTTVQFISGALLLAQGLSAELAKKEQIEDLITEIENALRALSIEKKQSTLSDPVVVELRAALGHTRTALTIAEIEAGTYESAKLRLGWAAARLKRASERLKQK